MWLTAGLVLAMTGVRCVLVAGRRSFDGLLSGETTRIVGSDTPLDTLENVNSVTWPNNFCYRRSIFVKREPTVDSDEDRITGDIKKTHLQNVT